MGGADELRRSVGKRLKRIETREVSEATRDAVGCVRMRAGCADRLTPFQTVVSLALHFSDYPPFVVRRAQRFLAPSSDLKDATSSSRSDRRCQPQYFVAQ